MEKAERHLLAPESTELCEIIVVQALVSRAELDAGSERAHLFGFVLSGEHGSEILALPVAKHSSTEFDEALNGRLLSDAGKAFPTGLLSGPTTFMPVRSRPGTVDMQNSW